MSDTSTGTGKVVVNRSMSLDGFIAGPGDAMDWIFDFVAPDAFPQIAAQPCRKRQAEVPAQAPAAAAGGPCRAIELQP